ncbi:interleukin-1 beta isoform X2 [Myxocyprinus asiaticus]|uniref:interleukin-1 beta isoform X2 n=1 Tax=Myxocyprinus asiaticus TaxID=70543 RepID=UPI0022229E0D|nr:interleukin-1 beta isoform X2 [Myxocyprinus asiaticus]
MVLLLGKQHCLTMACEGFEVTLALDYASKVYTAFDSDSTEYDEMDCSDPLAMSGQCDMHEGIKVEMWTHPHNSMRQVVNLIVALKRMKRFKQQSSDFGDDELLSIFMDNVIEERCVNWVQKMAHAGKGSYNKSKRILQCTVCDQFHKSLVRSGGALHLKAVTLKGGNAQHKVRFNLSTYVSTSPSVADSQPVCLEISKSNLYLACTKQNPTDNPTLVLKEVTDTLNTITSDDPNGLLFFRKETGVSVNTFESVKYPGWFISTAFDDNEQVNVCQQPADRIISFKLNDQVLI